MTKKKNLDDVKRAGYPVVTSIDLLKVFQKSMPSEEEFIWLFDHTVKEHRDLRVELRKRLRKHVGISTKQDYIHRGEVVCTSGESMLYWHLPATKTS